MDFQLLFLLCCIHLHLKHCNRFTAPLALCYISNLCVYIYKELVLLSGSGKQRRIWGFFSVYKAHLSLIYREIEYEIFQDPK